MTLAAYLNGLFLGAGLIIAIGAQNAFVLRQGLMRRHVLAVVLACALSDMVLIAVGVFGLSAISGILPGFEAVAKWGGAAFLLAYGLFAARRALSPHAMTVANTEGASLKATIAICLGFTLLNPHVYLDTVVLVGTIGTKFEGADRIAYMLGAWSASLLWFFGLGYGAQLLIPVFAKPVAWRILDGLIAVIMLLLAWSLVRG